MVPVLDHLQAGKRTTRILQYNLQPTGGSNGVPGEKWRPPQQIDVKRKKLDK